MEDAKRKSVAALIVAKLKPKKDAESMPEDSMDERSEMAQELMDAIKNEDAEALADALEGFVEMCRSKED